MELLLGDKVESKLLDKVEIELFENRVIYLNEDISPDTISSIVPLIHKINIEDKNIDIKDRTPLKIFVNTFGGDPYSGFGIVGAIENSETPIYTVCETFAMSMGLPIFLSGHKRFLGKYATLLYHELRSAGINGTREEIKRLDKEYDRLQKVYDDYVIGHSTITQDILESHQEKVSDWYIGFDESKEFGLFTDVYEGLHKIK